jgi:hypothetical protein
MRQVDAGSVEWELLGGRGCWNRCPKMDGVCVWGGGGEGGGTTGIFYRFVKQIILHYIERLQRIQAGSNQIISERSEVSVQVCVEGIVWKGFMNLSLCTPKPQQLTDSLSACRSRLFASTPVTTADTCTSALAAGQSYHQRANDNALEPTRVRACVRARAGGRGGGGRERG